MEAVRQARGPEVQLGREQLVDPVEFFSFHRVQVLQRTLIESCDAVAPSVPPRCLLAGPRSRVPHTSKRTASRQRAEQMRSLARRAPAVRVRTNSSRSVVLCVPDRCFDMLFRKGHWRIDIQQES